MLTVERSYRVQQAERIAYVRNRQRYKPVGLITQCAWCKRVKTTPSKWERIPIEYGRDVSHGVCPKCSEKAKKEGK